MNTILPIDKHMEEFIGQENKNIYEALTSGIHSVTWPGQCRNCEWTYSEQMKKDVVREMLNNPMTDFLRIVSDVFKSHHSEEGRKIRYCCINNFRPLIERGFRAERDDEFDETKKYRVFSETLVIEEGLEEWYEVSWSTDDTDMLEEARREIVNEPVLIPASPSTKKTACHVLNTPSLFDMIEQLTA